MVNVQLSQGSAQIIQGKRQGLAMKGCFESQEMEEVGTEYFWAQGRIKRL